ncbi:transcription factor CSA-like [Phragmites australis]|uniref:transcription factor CSA-like n=1 Tax=Phragmites australis TaxID=29695 RepID=UPI002D76667F|nr:transcription factor CSA-like [Phragmites australis]
MDSGVFASSAPPAAAGVRCVLLIKLPPAVARVRCVLRIRPPPAWTPQEDARLENLAREHGFRHWRGVAARMPGRSSRQCRDRWRHHLARDVYHRPFTAQDDDDLARLYLRHAGRWKDISRAVHGRTSRVMRRRWKELGGSDAFLSKLWRPLPTPADQDVRMEAHSDSSTSLSSQEPHADAVAPAVASCSLGRDAKGAGAGTSLAAGFTCVAIV